MQIDYVALGEKIKKARINKGYTQEYTATKADISLSHASNVETGKTKVSLSTLIEIANTLDVTVDLLLSDNYENKDSIIINEINNILKTCNSGEQQVILETVRALSFALKNN